MVPDITLYIWYISIRFDRFEFHSVESHSHVTWNKLWLGMQIMTTIVFFSFDLLRIGSMKCDTIHESLRTITILKFHIPSTLFVCDVGQPAMLTRSSFCCKVPREVVKRYCHLMVFSPKFRVFFMSRGFFEYKIFRGRHFVTGIFCGNKFLRRCPNKTIIKSFIYLIQFDQTCVMWFRF